MHEFTNVLHERAMAHAWAWFSLHAAQRMQMLNFWLISVAFLTTGLVSAVGGGAKAAGVGVAFAGAWVTAGFLLLERRTRGLVKVAEDALRVSEDALADALCAPQFALIRRANRQEYGTYGQVIPLLQLTVGAAFVVFGVAILVFM